MFGAPFSTDGPSFPRPPALPTDRSRGRASEASSSPHVFDAQMVVGDPKKHPKFAGNVISIDTRPMTRPTEELPGGRYRYKGSAESSLEIGKAMGNAIVELPSK